MKPVLDGTVALATVASSGIGATAAAAAAAAQGAAGAMTLPGTSGIRLGAEDVAGRLGGHGTEQTVGS